MGITSKDDGRKGCRPPRTSTVRSRSRDGNKYSVPTSYMMKFFFCYKLAGAACAGERCLRGKLADFSAGEEKVGGIDFFLRG